MGFVPDLRALSGDTLRAVSDGAIEQLAGRFDGLPRPLLAAIGAGDLAVEHLAVLRESVRQQVDGIDLDGQEIVAAAAGVAASVQSFAGELPRRLQEMAAELPGRVAALTRATGDLDPAAVVSTLEAYTEAAGVIYGGLARRGDRIWSDVRGASSRPGSVIDAVPDRVAGTVRAVHDADDESPSGARSSGGPASRSVPRRAATPSTERKRPTVATTATTPAGVGVPTARRPVPPTARPATAPKRAPVVTPAPLKPAAPPARTSAARTSAARKSTASAASKAAAAAPAEATTVTPPPVPRTAAKRAPATKTPAAKTPSAKTSATKAPVPTATKAPVPKATKATATKAAATKAAATKATATRAGKTSTTKAAPARSGKPTPS